MPKFIKFMGITINTAHILSLDYKYNVATKKHFLKIYMSGNVFPSRNLYSFGFTSMGRYNKARDWLDRQLKTDDVEYTTLEM